MSEGFKEWKIIKSSSLDLSFNSIGNTGCMHLSKAFKEWIDLSSSRILLGSNRSIGDAGWEYLGAAFAQWKNLKSNYLDLNRINIKDQGCKFLSECF